MNEQGSNGLDRQRGQEDNRAEDRGQDYKVAKDNKRDKRGRTGSNTGTTILTQLPGTASD